MKTKLLALFALAVSLAAPAAAETLRIISPYIGSVTNKYADTDRGLDLRDTAQMRGIYAQWINTEKFQANAFYYGAPDVNYSEVTGLHLNLDFYFRPTPAGKWVAGAGLESLSIDLSAGRNVPPLNSFDMDNDILFYFARAGRYFYYRKGLLDASLLPYAGYAREKVNGEINMDPPGPGTVRVNLDDKDSQPLAGLNLNATIAHFIDLQGKWMGRFKDGERLDEYSLMANFYLNRHWGLSYRYKYMEYGSSSNGYHLGGVAYCF